MNDVFLTTNFNYGKNRVYSGNDYLEFETNQEALDVYQHWSHWAITGEHLIQHDTQSSIGGMASFPYDKLLKGSYREEYPVITKKYGSLTITEYTPTEKPLTLFWVIAIATVLGLLFGYYL